MKVIAYLHSGQWSPYMSFEDFKKVGLTDYDAVSIIENLDWEETQEFLKSL